MNFYLPSWQKTLPKEINNKLSRTEYVFILAANKKEDVCNGRKKKQLSVYLNDITIIVILSYT